MYNENDIINKLRELLERQPAAFQKGRALNGGVGKQITVNIDGKKIKALSYNVISPNEVTVFYDSTHDRYIAWQQPNRVLRSDKLIYRRTKPTPIKRTFGGKYLFKVFTRVVDQLLKVQGFGSEVEIENSDGYDLVGLTNTGDGYVAIAKSGDTYLFDVDGVQTTIDLTSPELGLDYIPSFNWYGDTYIMSDLIQFAPSLTFTSNPSTNPVDSVESMTPPSYGLSKIWLNTFFGTTTESGSNYEETRSGIGYVTFSYKENEVDIPITIPSACFITPTRKTIQDIPSDGIDNTTFNKESLTQLSLKKTSVVNNKMFTLSPEGLIEFDINTVSNITGSYDRDTTFESYCNSDWRKVIFNGNQSSPMFILDSLTGEGIGEGNESGSYTSTETTSGIQPFITDAIKKQYTTTVSESETITGTQSSIVTFGNIVTASGMDSTRWGDLTNIDLPGYEDPINFTNYDLSGIKSYDIIYEWSVNLSLTYNYSSSESYVFRYLLFSEDCGIYLHKETDNSYSETTSKVGVNTKGERDPQELFFDEPIFLWYPVANGAWYNKRNIYHNPQRTLLIDPPLQEDTHNTFGFIFTREKSLHSLYNINNKVVTSIDADNKTSPPISCVVQMGNVSHEIKDSYNNYSSFTFFCENREIIIGNNTFTVLPDQSFIGVDTVENKGLERNIVKQSTFTTTTDSVGNTTSDYTKTYHTQNFYQLQGNVEIYFNNTGLTYKCDGQIISYTNEINGDYQKFLTITVNVTSITEINFYHWFNTTNDTVIVSYNNHTTSIIEQLKNNISMVNCYKYENTIRIAIAKIPQQTDTTAYADIYEFDTVNKKFIRIGNDSSDLSAIDDTSNYISYHP